MKSEFRVHRIYCGKLRTAITYFCGISETDIHTDRQTEGQRQRDRDKQTETEIDRDRE